MLHGAGKPIVAAICGFLLLASAGDRERPRTERENRDGVDLHVSFGGLICHVFDGGHAPRAVMIRGTNSMPHRALLTLSEHQIEFTDVPLQCANGECTLNLENT